MSHERQIEELARRINWLTRHRRKLSIALAVIASLFIMWWFTGWLPSNWPGGHMVCMTIALGVVCWYGIETTLGFVIALWETDHSQLTRRPGLPRAEVVVRRK